MTGNGLQGPDGQRSYCEMRSLVNRSYGALLLTIAFPSTVPFVIYFMSLKFQHLGLLLLCLEGTERKVYLHSSSGLMYF